MPRYLVEREFPDCLNIPQDAAGASACLSVVEKNAAHGVTWVLRHPQPQADLLCV